MRQCTYRQIFNERVRPVGIAVAVFLALLFLVLFGVHAVALEDSTRFYLVLVAFVPLLIVGGLGFRRARCPACGGWLWQYMAPRWFSLPKSIRVCPFCGARFDDEAPADKAKP